LSRLACVDYLCFGAECGDAESLMSMAQKLDREESRQILLAQLDKGLPYAAARQIAADDSGNLLSSPNNILGLEYCKALKKLNSTISVLPVKRMGSGYHSLELQQEFCSASAVRAKFSEQLLHSESANNLAASDVVTGILSELSCYLPDITLSVLREKSTSGELSFPEMLSSLLHYKLLSEEQNGFEQYLDVTPDLSDRIINLLPKYETLEQFTSLVKSRQFTEARIRRAFLHILLNITGETTESYRSQGIVFYARALGFRKTAGPLLHQIKEYSSIPLITKLADAKKILSGSALQMLTQDIYASHIYQMAGRSAQPIRNEYTCSPIII
jgi:predicted nucleotidyltransferase